MMDTKVKNHPYTVEFIKHRDHLEAHISGEHDNYETSIQYWTDIAKKLRQHRLDKVLIIEDIAETSELTDIFRLVTELGDVGFRGVKVAFVDKYLSHQEQNDFGVMVGKNRGLHGQAFGDVEKAREWLLDDMT